MACLDARYLSAAICSESGCCSIEPESPEALAGPEAFSRMESARSSVTGVPLNGQRTCASNVLFIPWRSELTMGRAELLK